MAKNVSEKNTKAQILDAYQEVIQELNSLKEAKKTTADVIKEKKVKETKEAAKEVVGLGILNDDVVAKYNALMETKEMLEKEIELLNNKVEEVRTTAFEEGKAKAKKEADTAKVFSDRAHKADLERKDDRIATLEAALEESKKAHESDKAKLDAAYTRIQEMAIEAAKNSGVRMVESNNK